MIRVRSLAALGGVALVLAAAPVAHAQGLTGKWSSEQACGAQSRQIVFRGNTMELWEQNQRLFSGNVRYQTTGNQTAVTVVSINRETPPLRGNPEVGDVATFRRDGNRMFPVSVVRSGERRAAPGDVPPFHLCR